MNERNQPSKKNSIGFAPLVLQLLFVVPLETARACATTTAFMMAPV